MIANSQRPTKLTLALDPGDDIARRTSWIVLEPDPDISNRNGMAIVGYVNAKSRVEAANRAEARWPTKQLHVFLKPNVL